MKNKINIVFVFLLLIVLIPQVTYASWWNPFTWKIFNKKSENTQQVSKVPSIEKTELGLDLKTNDTETRNLSLTTESVNNTKKSKSIEFLEKLKKDNLESDSQKLMDKNHIDVWMSGLTEDREWFNKIIKQTEGNKKTVGSQIIDLEQYHIDSLNQLAQLSSGDLKSYILSSVDFYVKAKNTVTDFNKNYDESIRIANEGIKSIDYFQEQLKTNPTEKLGLDIYKARNDVYPVVVEKIYKTNKEVTDVYGQLSDLYSGAWKTEMDTIKSLNNRNIISIDTQNKLNAIKDEALNETQNSKNNYKKVVCNSTTQFNGLFAKMNTETICRQY